MVRDSRSLCLYFSLEAKSDTDRVGFDILRKKTGWVGAGLRQAGLLASGGGTADRKICFWNAASGTMLQVVDTSSQVCPK